MNCTPSHVFSSSPLLSQNSGKFGGWPLCTLCQSVPWDILWVMLMKCETEAIIQRKWHAHVAHCASRRAALPIVTGVVGRGGGSSPPPRPPPRSPSTRTRPTARYCRSHRTISFCILCGLFPIPSPVIPSPSSHYWLIAQPDRHFVNLGNGDPRRS